MMGNRLGFGMFLMPVHDPNKPLVQCYDEDLELAQRCEQLGFTDFWVGEHHSSTYENIVMPEIFIAKAFGMTDSMRFGPAPVCLQYHHPAQVAGRLAFLDHLSHGRLNVCFGPGAIPSDMELYGVTPQESGARVSEAIEMILDIWNGDPPYRIDGQFWSVTLQDSIDPEMGLGALHRPLQQPHPPIFVPAIARGSVGVRKAAGRGFRLISHHMVSEETLRDHWETYRAGAAAAGRSAHPADWCVSRNVFVADSTEEARPAGTQQLSREVHRVHSGAHPAWPGRGYVEAQSGHERRRMWAGLLHGRGGHRRRSGDGDAADQRPARPDR